MNFISLQIKRMTRSSFWQKNVALNIVIGFFLFVLLLELLTVGVFLDKILTKAGNGVTPEQLLNKGLIYYFLITFMLRFFVQDLPTMEITPLLHLPVKKYRISLFLNLRSLLSFFNFLPFFLFLPFAVAYLPQHFSGFTALVWFAAVFLFEMSSNFLLIRIKRQSTVKPVVILLVFAVAFLLVLAEKYHLFSLSVISQWYFGKLLQQPVWLVLPAVTAFLFFAESMRYLRRHSYLDELSSKKKRNEKWTRRFEGLEKRGKIGAMMLKELRLLLRNKRSKQMIFYSLPLGLLYGFIFYPNAKNLEHNMILSLVGIFVTGIFLITYGQYILAWESRHFDFILVSNVNFEDFFRAKYYLMVIPTLIFYVLTIPYVYFGTKILLVNTVMMLYNVGVNGIYLLFTASFNRKRMELDRGQMMNYQGVGINNFLNVIPLILMPGLLLVLFSYLFGNTTALLMLTILSLLGVLLHRTFIRLATQFFKKNRYKIAEGYRSS